MNRKGILGVLLLTFLLPLLSFSGAHKFYVSVTNVDYAPEEASLQVISRIFTDDLEEALLQRYDFRGNLGTPEESPLAGQYIERYFQSRFEVQVNDSPRAFTFLGTRYDKDLVICYLEVPDVPGATLKSVGVRNDLLTEIFEEQKNLVHLKVLGKKKSFVLIRENNKGMLNL
ncbi:DUF6702 family protein [Robiginitalea marina]|uniref:Peptidase E n=1 Tax=Robiginitalea marina TaxID=2954105 RepID=A0ABT1AY36_9FLAO|nr:DUF6702 family protein [Robiginitalea marina]MCO5724826.1 hypothetical protein [Robiginitalea marina]